VGFDMSDKVRPLQRCSKGSSLYCVDTQWAAEQAFVSARTVLGWSRDRTAASLGTTASTVKRWERGDAPVNPWQVDTCDEFSAVFWPLYRERREAIRRAA